MLGVDHLRDELPDVLGHLLLPLCFFAGRQVAQLLAWHGKQLVSKLAYLPNVRTERLPGALPDLGRHPPVVLVAVLHRLAPLDDAGVVKAPYLVYLVAEGAAA